MDKENVDLMQERINKMGKDLTDLLLKYKATNQEAEILACFLLANVFQDAMEMGRHYLKKESAQKIYVQKFNELLKGYFENCIE
jgi:hypothetical protein